jgi:hypothetical protein
VSAQNSPQPRHRKNAAEWLMFVVLWPIARVMRWFGVK